MPYHKAVGTKPGEPTKYVQLTEEEEVQRASEEEINAVKINKNRNKRLRELEMPSLEAQLDMIYSLGLDAWRAKRKEIEDKYPDEQP